MTMSEDLFMIHAIWGNNFLLSPTDICDVIKQNEPELANNDF